MVDRIVQTFGRRRARSLRGHAEEAFDVRMPQIQLDLENSLPVLQDLFDVPVQEVWLEIGFGGGENLAYQLRENPHVGLIGCEPFVNGVARLLTLVDEGDFARLRVLNDDVRLLLSKIPDNSLSRVFILFPDPWPKKRHHKRRLIQASLLDVLSSKMKKGGVLRIASDAHNYVAHIIETLTSHPAFSQILGPQSMDLSTWTERPEGWSATRYEQKAIRKGMQRAYMEFVCHE